MTLHRVRRLIDHLLIFLSISNNQTKRPMEVTVKTFWLDTKVTVFCCDGVIPDMVLYVTPLGQHKLRWKEYQLNPDDSTHIIFNEKPFDSFIDACTFAVDYLGGRFDTKIGQIGFCSDEADDIPVNMIKSKNLHFETFI